MPSDFPKASKKDLNWKQIRSLRSIVRSARNIEFIPDFPYKIVQLEVSVIHTNPSGRSVLSVVVKGMKPEWKGTMAEIVCGKRGHFFVGPMGGIVSKSAEKGNIAKAEQHPLIYGWGH